MNGTRIRELNKTISMSLVSKHSLYSNSFVVDKFAKNVSSFPTSEWYGQIRDATTFHTAPYNQHRYKQTMLFRDKQLVTKLIEWKPHGCSPQDDKELKGGLMVILKGEFKEKRYHSRYKYFQYERFLQTHTCYCMDAFHFDYALQNITGNTALTLHFFSQDDSVMNTKEVSN